MNERERVARKRDEDSLRDVMADYCLCILCGLRVRQIKYSIDKRMIRRDDEVGMM